MIFNNKENEFINIKLDSLYFLIGYIYTFLFYMKIIILKTGKNIYDKEYGGKIMEGISVIVKNVVL